MINKINWFKIKNWKNNQLQKLNFHAKIIKTQLQLLSIRYMTWIKKNLTIIYLLLAVIFILFPNTSYSPFSEKWNEILQKIGFISLTSGIFAGVLKSIQFTGLFQEELQKIVSGSEFLKNRKDLQDLWKEISKIIYSKKFPEISEELEDTILNSYFQKKNIIIIKI
ncbi:hypothetical protein L950_0219440 [Sphingobacterium sp. IITKGP-BTPF85]|nr:hypothetical protein L950_0219440 [Sphingobacterium sp. IITKGP-BTPF85]